MPLYVSPVEGHLAPRYGTARVTPGRNVEHVLVGAGGRKRSIPLREPGIVKGHEYIGVTRTRDPETGEITITWDTNLVMMLSDREVTQFRREYQQLLADGALKERTEADYKAFADKQQKRGEEHDAKVKSEAEKKKAADAKAMQGAPAA